MATTMTAKRGPRGGEMRGSGGRARACPIEDGVTDHPSTADLRASLSTRDQELEEMRRRLRELEKLEVEIPPAASHEEESETATTAEKAEVDARSIYVGNVDYACLPEEVQQHFQFCGTINRVTILTDSFGQPKGFAYVEFDEVEAVQNALLLNETELHGRPLKVCPKRTNIPGMKQSRGRHPVHPFYPSYG
ncbi:Polyadenylate-binding protein 1 [Dichanthelium oligosanthes]|uniref:Polyadenylate-binding protein 1 n=1 Tax=Dichanthelium oligosanthes TaxID=888268 RepID=A0A1E5V2G5_9POAL|nr:Polyadenylate-binding protein 1 [Dichanthelium oligosanthes]